MPRGAQNRPVGRNPEADIGGGRKLSGSERLESRRAQLASAWLLLGAMSYRGVLARGFALVRDEAETPLRRAAELRQAQRLEIEFADGKIGAVAGGRVGPPLTPPALLPRRRPRADKGSDGQGSLF